jgi:predicted HTH transcriptional regulator
MGNLEFLEAQGDYLDAIKPNECNIFLVTSTQDDFLKIVTGLSNHLGGSCWIGLISTTKIKGCDADFEMNAINQTCTSVNIKPVITKYIKNNKQLLHVVIPALPTKIALDNTYFISSNSTFIEANKVVVNSWKLNINEDYFFSKLEIEQQETILDTLHQNSKFTLSKAYSLFSMSKSVIDKIITELYRKNQINLIIENNTIYFSCC